MAKSVFSVTTKKENENAVTVSISASPGNGKSALQNAISAALVNNESFLSANEVGNRSVDLEVESQSPTGAKCLYTIQFRAGSGTNGTTPSPLLILASPELALTAQDAAINAAAATGGVPNSAIYMCSVDVEA